MPYDSNRPMGLDALSPTVSAYKQFVEGQNRVDDANIVPFLVSRGEPQLAGLIAKKMRVENAAKTQQQLAQQPPAAPPTVADQYNMAEQQQAQQAMMEQMRAAQQAQAAPGLAGMPNPAMENANFAGGGIVAMAGGGDVQHFQGGGVPNPADFFVNAAGEASSDPYAELWKANAKAKQEADEIVQAAAKKRAAEAAARAAGASEPEAIAAGEKAAESWLRGQFRAPTLGKAVSGAANLASKAPGALMSVGKGAVSGVTGLGAAAFGEGSGIWDMWNSDPESLQATSRAAQLGMTVDPNSKFKTGLATFLGSLESALPTSMFYTTPAEKARARTEEMLGPSTQTTRSSDPEIAKAYMDLVKKYGANSPEVKDFEAKYRASSGITTPAPNVPPAGLNAGLGAGRKKTDLTRTPTPAAPTAEAAVPEDPFAGILKALNPLETYQQEQLARETAGGYGRGSKALGKEEELYKKRQDSYKADKDEAKYRALLSFGSALASSTSPHFGVALGEAFKEGGSALLKDLKELKAEQTKLENQRLDLEYKREQAVQSGDAAALALYLNDKKTHDATEESLAIKRAEFDHNYKIQDRIDQRNAEDNRRAENVAHIQASAAYHDSSARAADLRGRVATLTAQAKIQQNIAGNFSVSEKERATALQRLSEIDAELAALASGGDTAGGAGKVTTSGWTK